MWCHFPPRKTYELLYYKTAFKVEVNNERGFPTLNLLLPKQPNQFNNIHYNFRMIRKGTREMGIETRILEVSDDASSNVPPDYGVDVKQVSYGDLGDFLATDEIYIGLDDYHFLERIKGINHEKLLIWVHYFNGASLFFKQYIDWQESGKFRKLSRRVYRDFFPTPLQLRMLGPYLQGLKKRPVFAQSLWTGLLLNRIYNAGCKGIVYNPIDPEEFPSGYEPADRTNVVVFLGGPDDTHLEHTTNFLKEMGPLLRDLEIHSFGSDTYSQRLAEMSGTEIKHHSRITRRDLFALEKRSVFTITPVYGGNFEMVPIESLMNLTPVISYLQPFMEVTGLTDLVANLQNGNLALKLARKWMQKGMGDSLEVMRDRIVSSMNYGKVAKDLVHITESTIPGTS